MTNQSAQFRLWVCVYSRVRSAYARSTIKLNTLGPEGAEGRSGAHMSSPSTARASIFTKMLQNAKRVGGNATNLGKRSVWSTWRLGYSEHKTMGKAREHRTQEQRWRMACIPKFLRWKHTKLCQSLVNIAKEPQMIEDSQPQRWETQPRATSTMIRMFEVKRLLGHGIPKSIMRWGRVAKRNFDSVLLNSPSESVVVGIIKESKSASQYY